MGLFDRNYRRSNAFEMVDFSPTSRAKKLVRILATKQTARIREQLCTDLLDELCDSALIDIVDITVEDKKQYHRKKGGKLAMKQYGYYRPDKKQIVVHNKTAVRGQILAAKSFIDTVLHEWVHHYDYAKLGLRSIHTKGFYARLQDIKQKLGYFDL